MIYSTSFFLLVYPATYQQYYQRQARNETFQTFLETPSGVCHWHLLQPSFFTTSGKSGAFQRADESTEHSNLMDTRAKLMSSEFWIALQDLSELNPLGVSSQCPTNHGPARYGTTGNTTTKPNILLPFLCTRPDCTFLVSGLQWYTTHSHTRPPMVECCLRPLWVIG